MADFVRRAVPNPYQLSDYDYSLPETLIAQHPLQERSQSRLLIADTVNQSWKHGVFTDVFDLVSPDDLVVFNNTRVIPARLMGKKASGGRIECLLERVTGDQTGWFHVRASKSPKPGSELLFADGSISATVLDRNEGLFQLRFDINDHLHTFLHEHGSIPLPPYITRDVEGDDSERYQTVYASELGACAAPTAGLHFDEALLKRLDDKGVQRAEVTLHVGAGTFQPVRVDDIRTHAMHQEWIEVSDEVAQAVRECRARGGRVIAVGTTSVRSLESAARETGEVQAYSGDTDLFLYPGQPIHAVDVLITNFHLPKSSLLMLVSAIAGYDFIFKLYEAAVAEKYRFFSYGDAMWLPKYK